MIVFKIMYTQKIPDYVFNDIKQNATSFDRRGFIKFSKSRYDAYCSDQTKQWIEHINFEPKFVAFFIKQDLHDITIPDCIHCGKQLKPKDVLLGHKFCCHYCQTQSDQRREAAKKTNLEKYGVDNPAKAKQVLDKRKQTCLEKYGAESVVQADFFKEKSKQTLMEHYGVDAPFKSKQIKQKATQTVIDRYGVDNVWKLDEIQQKAKATVREKYGVEHYSQTQECKERMAEFYSTKDQQYWDEILEKKKKSNLEKYGVEFTSSLPEVKQQIRQTNQQRYGSYSWLASPEGKRDRKLRQFDKFVADLKSKSIQLLTPKEMILDSDCDIQLECDVCGKVWTQSQTLCSQLVVCRDCVQELRSREEKLFAKFIEALVDPKDIVYNDRTVLDGKELDVYIPKLKLAFEFNGDYWHSDAIERIDEKYHLDKTIGCAKKGIRLIHIFEYQWRTRSDQIKRFLYSLLSTKQQIIYARQCIVKELDNDTFNKFVDHYHIQGSVNCSTRLGLYYNDKIVAVAGFTKNRFKQDEIELTRYCVKTGCRIVGGLQKLITHSPFNEVYSYVDFAHFNGKGFKESGFELIGHSKPNYVWISNDRIYSRYQTQKHNLANILHEEFDPNLSEVENMRNAGFNRLFDCGNLKFKWIRKA